MFSVFLSGHKGGGGVPRPEPGQRDQPGPPPDLGLKRGTPRKLGLDRAPSPPPQPEQRGRYGMDSTPLMVTLEIFLGPG